MGEEQDESFLSFLNSLNGPTISEPPKSTGILIPHKEKEVHLDPLLYTESGAAIELNECKVEWLTGEEEVIRILDLCANLVQRKQVQGSSNNDDDTDYYAVLKVPILASMDLVKKHYKKLSVLVHPDKCEHAGAQEAFHCVNTAYKELQKPQYRLRFRESLSGARERLRREVHDINKRRQKGEAVPASWYSEDDTEEIVYDESDPRILNRLLELSELILAERKEKLEYAEKVRRANLLYEIMQHEEKAAREYKEELNMKQWKARQEERVEGWRQFRDVVKTKRTGDTVLDKESRKKSRIS